MSNDNSQSTIGELRQLNNLVEEIDVSLQSQKEILKRRGMNLPPLVSQTLSTIKSDLQKIETGIMQEQSELTQLRALADMSAKINTSLDINQVLEDAMDVVITLTQAERGYIILKNMETDELEFRISKDNELGQIQGMRSGGGSGTVQISMGVVRDVIDTGVAMLADNAYKDERLQGNVSIANFVLRSVLCVPMSYKSETIGVLYVDNRLRAGIFTEREKSLLMAFAHTAAVAIANARLYAEIQLLLAEITSTQKLMDNVFNSVGSGIVATNSTDIVTTFNLSAEKILETKTDTAIGQNLHSVLPKMTADLDEHLANVREKSEAQILDGELELATRGRVALTMKLTPLRDAKRETQGVTVVIDDITEQVENEQRLATSKRYLPPQLIDDIHTIANLSVGGERRLMTCLYVDVRPFSTFPDKVQPEQLMEILNTYLSIATDCIHKQEGIIDKYMGTEVMTLFNTQLNQMEDHASRAVETALMMRDGFLKLYAEQGISPDPHFYRIGMHTGVATMGNVGSLSRREFTAIGDTINTSKRIEENASRQQILVSETSRVHLLENPSETAVNCRFEGPIVLRVKGRELEVPVYEVFRS